MIYVTCNHYSPRYQLQRQPFAIIEAGDFEEDGFRIGGDWRDGYFALSPAHGASRAGHRTPRSAVLDLLSGRGCYDIQIEDAPAVSAA